MVEVTKGQKIGAVAGAAIALSDGHATTGELAVSAAFGGLVGGALVD